jgi:hypothetical protein
LTFMVIWSTLTTSELAMPLLFPLSLSLLISFYSINTTPSHDVSTILTTLWSSSTVDLPPSCLLAFGGRKMGEREWHALAHVKILQRSCVSPSLHTQPVLARLLGPHSPLVPSWKQL